MHSKRGVIVTVRKVIKIDQKKCNGCGLCVPACAEGAIRIIDGKAKLVNDSFCDGLGACLGECPEGAISFEEREAAEFDKAAVKIHLAKLELNPAIKLPEEGPKDLPHVCPSAKLLDLKNEFKLGLSESPTKEPIPSQLTHWPIKLNLVPPMAPFLQDSDLLLIADCVPFAYPEIHNNFLSGRSVVIGCPKFDDNEFYLQKLTGILTYSDIKSLTVVHMEVPCCFGFWHLGQQAIKGSGKDIPLYQKIIGVGGNIRKTDQPEDKVLEKKGGE